MSKVGQLTELTKNNLEFYSDMFTDFSRHAVTGELNRKTNENAVKQSVKNLLLTNKYERLFNPEIGSNLKSILFENMTPQLPQILNDYIGDVFDNFEPRADFLFADMSFDHDRNGASIDVHFTIINSQVQATLPIYIERTR